MTRRTSNEVVIVGAGFGGLTMAHELLSRGVRDILVLESGDDVGGVWRENIYPGCSCDVPSHLYSFDFAPHRDSELRYPSQERILSYLQTTAERHGLRKYIRFSTAVDTAVYSHGRWTLTTTGGDDIRARHVVWAVGQLHRPALPQIPGAQAFRGTSFHSARWEPTVDLTARFAVIGTGSSAAQLVPELARTATSVTVYQRTPAWVLPKPSERFGPVTRYALSHVPGLHRLYRTGLYLGADLVLAPIMRNGWSARPARWVARAHLRRQVRDRTLREKLTPTYRIGEKRILLDSRFYPALTQQNVELVTEPIARITPEGIRTADGTERAADVIVYATGFRAPEFLGDITIRGRGGIDLHQAWAGQPEAYLGIAVPGFPSMFLIAGPNSFTPANSNPTMKAHQARYIADCLELSDRLDAPVEVTAAAMDTYRRWLARSLATTVWADGVPAWFKTPDGRITNPWPASARRFARMTSQDPAASFEPVRDRPAGVAEYVAAGEARWPA